MPAKAGARNRSVAFVRHVSTTATVCDLRFITAFSGLAGILSTHIAYYSRAKKFSVQGESSKTVQRARRDGATL